MTTNKALWERVKTTDPKHVKAITGKQYSGNSPKPYWIVERLTDEFGPCGIGWGFRVLDERMERLTECEVLHVARLLFWYELDGKRGEFEQIGQTRAMYAKRDGSLLVDEDAPKKSVTDALVKCASYLGFAGDIFSGMWDDSKYVAEAGKHWASLKAEKKKQGAMTAKSAAMGELTPDQQKFVARIAAAIAGKFGAGNDWGAYEELESALAKVRENDGDEQMCQVAIYGALDAQQRAALDVMAQEARKVAA